MIIKPYSQIAKTKANVAEFPACKLFLPCDEGSGNALINAVTGQSIDLGMPITWGVNKASFGSGSPTAVTLASSIAVGTNTAIMIVVGQGATVGGIYLNDGTNNNFQFNQNGTVLTDGTNSASASQTFSDAEYAGATVFTAGTANENTTHRVTEATASAAVQASAAPGDFTTMPTITKIHALRAVGTIAVYSVSFWVFGSHVPSASEINSVLAWMRNRHVVGGLKYLPPHWLGKS